MLVMSLVTFQLSFTYAPGLQFTNSVGFTKVLKLQFNALELLLPSFSLYASH